MQLKIFAFPIAAVSLSLGGCASPSGAGLAEVAQNCPACVSSPRSLAGTEAFHPGDRALLRESKNLFDGMVADGESEMEEGRVMRVYRWGRNGDVPLGAYGWNAGAGERWHVVRAPTVAGERESCGRKGVRPIDEFYSADGLTLTVVSVSGDQRRLVFGSPVLAN